MKKIFTLFAALAMVMSMSAVNMTGGEELYLTPNSNWLQKDGNGKAPRFAIYVYGSGDAWASMTAVEGESNLYKAVVPKGNWTNVIFCRMNGGNTSNGWGNKYNQTGDLTYNGTQNWYTVKEGTWDNGGGTWALYAPEAPKSYKDITITIVANATPKIHYWDGGDKMVGTVWDNLPEMTATGEANTYSCTIKDVDEAIGVKYLIKVGEVQSADQQAFDNVTVNFKDLLPQVVLKGTIDNWGDKNKMTVSDDYLSASITLPLTATTYEWKLTVDGNWFGGSKYAITRDKNSVAVADNGDGNGKLTADLAGDYVFTYTYADQTLTVTYPALPVKYNVTVTAENGTVTGDGKYEEGKEATLTATAAEGYQFVNWTKGEEVVSTENPYTFTVTADIALVANFELIPVVEPEKPEPTYTENKLNTYAFGLESELNDTALVVTYRLNNSNATSVNVLVYKGENVVATVAGTTTIGVNTVAIPVATLPKGRMLTWSVEVNGTSVEAPTQEEKIYSFYHPSGVDIDNNPENPTFGMLLINEGMQAVKGSYQKDGSPYVSTNQGAGIFAFAPSFDLMPNGELPGYNGGIEFTNNRPDAATTAYAPRRIRISEDGRIFVTSLNTDGNYLWEVNADNMNEWTSVFKGTLNDNRELITEDSAFIAAPNTGFDVKGAGENLQLAMYSVNLPGITGAAMSGFRLHEYNLGTATEWTTAPSKALVEGKYAINYTGTQVEYDNEGGFWICSYRGTANDANPGLVHINKDGVEDAKLIWSNVRQAGIRFNKDFTKLVVAGNNGAAKKATIYTISKDANGAPVLTEEAVVDMAVVGNNLNDFAWDYAGNLYSCGNSAEKLAAWAMPYSGQVVTPAASKYAFHIGELLPDPAVVTEMVGVVKRAIQNGESTIVLTHETDGTAHIYEVTNGTILELLQNGVIARDPENAGDLLAISDIAVTEDGKLVATNYMITQSDDGQVVAGEKRGETRIYIWNDLHDAPSILFTSKMSSNWFQSKQGLTMAVKGTSDNMEIFMTGIHKSKAWARASSYRVIDGVYTEPDGNHNDHYYFYDINDAIALETTVGTQYELNASPLGEMNWILDAELINPVEIVESATNNVEIATSVALTEDLGKKFNGASYVTVGEQVLMVAPYATPEGKLTGVEILDITGGLDAAQYVDQLFIDEAVEATAAATAVEVVEGDEATALLITLVADATIYSLEATLAKAPNWEVYEDAITNLVIDYDNLLLIGGPGSAFQVEVVLGLGEYDRNTDTYQLLPASTISVLGSEATFVDGYASVDGIEQSATAVVHCTWNGMAIEFHLTMTSAPMEATKVVVENATIEIEKVLLFGDMYDYALKMTGVWHNEEDGLDYPVLVEVPVYYPEATEPSEIMSTVTVGGWEDDDPWLGFGEGTLTVTTVGDVITATGIVQNPMAGVAIDITISGSKTPTAIDNATITVKSVKVIKNGQLIIINNDVEYSAQGAVIK